MTGRLSKTKAMLLNGRCLNYLCDVKLSCKKYDNNPTDEEKESYLAISMSQCPLFDDKNPVTPRDKEPNRPYVESF